MTLIWHTRHYQSITIITMCMIILNILTVILQGTNDLVTSPDRCFALGFFQHFTAVSMITFYVLSTIHFFCLIYGAGRFQNYTFLNNKLVYLLIGFGFPFVNCMIVLGLIPLE